MRLRPTAPVADAALLVGDPGRALMLAQELLEAPKMSNHARGLWGYTGDAARGQMTIQATGIGGPSAAIVVSDLEQLGVRRAVRIGTCTALGGRARPGELLVVAEALAVGGSAAAFGVKPGGAVAPDARLRERLELELGDEARSARVASLDAPPAEGAVQPGEAADLQSVAVLARCAALGMAAAAVLCVGEGSGSEPLGDEMLDDRVKVAARAASAVL